MRIVLRQKQQEAAEMSQGDAGAPRPADGRKCSNLGDVCYIVNFWDAWWGRVRKSKIEEGRSRGEIEGIARRRRGEVFAQAAQAEAEQQRVQLGKLGAAQRARARACGEEMS